MFIFVAVVIIAGSIAIMVIQLMIEQFLTPLRIIWFIIKVIWFIIKFPYTLIRWILSFGTRPQVRVTGEFVRCSSVTYEGYDRSQYGGRRRIVRDW